MNNVLHRTKFTFISIALFCIFLLLVLLLFVSPLHNGYAVTTSAKSAVVMERSTRRVLFSKDCNTQRSMASTTKIMTALVVAENSDMSSVVAVPKEAVGVEGSSVYLVEGEHLTVKELLYGLMLRSGNDCAVALAIYVGGSVENFVNMMNDKAVELGAVNTHFANPHGLTNKNHYTTAYDLALITCSALENEIVKEVVSTKNVEISNDTCNYNRFLKNKNKLLFFYENADGVKTGYTKDAGRCFVGSATRNGMQVVVVVLNCGPMFEETATLLDYAFNNYKLVSVVPKRCVFEVDGIKYVCEEGLYYPLSADEQNDIDTQILSEENNLSIGLFINKQLLFSAKLVTI